MPLSQSPGKKAFGKNIAAEMDAGKPMKQSLAIAYSIKRKNQKKKMATGGPVEPKPLKVEPVEKKDSRPLNVEPLIGDKRDDLDDNQYADGGEVDYEQYDEPASDAIMRMREAKRLPYEGSYGGDSEDTNEPSVPSRKRDDERPSKDEYMAENFAFGGEAEEDMNPGTPKAKPDDRRLPQDEYMSVNWSEGSAPKRKPDDERPSEDQYMSDHFDSADSVESDPESIADEIMSQRRKMYADGGEVEDDQADMDQNAREWKNGEDDMSYNALRKENYSEGSMLEEEQPMDSNEHGHILVDEDEHSKVPGMRSKVDYEYHSEPDSSSRDMTDDIRRRMKMKKRF